MFFRQTARVEVPVAVMDQRLRDRLGADGLELETREAVRDGAAMVVPVDSGDAVPDQVRVDSLPPRRRGSVVAFPIRWHAIGPWGASLPTLDATIELVPTPDDAATEVVFVGSYRPPAGRAGEVVDGALLPRDADATLREYLRRLTVAAPEAGSQVSLSST